MTSLTTSIKLSLANWSRDLGSSSGLNKKAVNIYIGLPRYCDQLSEISLRRPHTVAMENPMKRVNVMNRNAHMGVLLVLGACFFRASVPWSHGTFHHGTVSSGRTSLVCEGQTNVRMMVPNEADHEKGQGKQEKRQTNQKESFARKDRGKETRQKRHWKRRKNKRDARKQERRNTAPLWLKNLQGFKFFRKT